MAKRVLGDDPFSNGEDEGSKGGAAKKGSRAPAAPSRRPGAKPSVPVKASPSKAPPASAKGSKAPAGHGAKPRTTEKPAATESAPVTEAGRPSPDEVRVPPHAAVPREAAEVLAEDDARTGVEEAAAQADGPPELLLEDFVADAPPWSTIPSSMPPATDADITVAVHDEPARPPLEQQIADVEARLDQLLHRVGGRSDDREALDRVAERLRAHVEAEAARVSTVPTAPREPDATHSPQDIARELLSSDFGSRQWGRVAMRDRAEEVDDFGRDEAYEKRWRPFFDFLYERWWRVDVHDIDRVPAEGRVVLCANHSGAVPYDGAMLATALRREHPSRRELRWLAEDFVFHMPFLGVFMNRIGAVRACQENAERLLRKDACVGVFPEGVKGISKLYRDRYKLQRFGRGGHVKLAMRTRAPLVPVAIIGAEEAHPLLAPTGLLAKSLGVPFAPITPTFPWLGPLGLLPLPARWKMYFLDPIPMDAYGPEAAEDEVLVGRLNEKIRGLIQDQVDRALRDRRGVFSG